MLLPLTLDRTQPLQQQLVDRLRGLIEAGVITSGERMPSTRAFAEQFGISRMTAVLVYERLTVAGLLHTVPAGGTYVGSASATPRKPLVTATPERDDTLPAIDVPDPTLFPGGRWRALVRESLEQLGRPVANPGAAARRALQRTLGNWLRGARGIDAAPEQILIAPNRQLALDALAHLLLDRGTRVAVEAPGDEEAAGVWAAHGARLVSVPVDAEGLIPAYLPKTPTALLQVMPGCHFPLGGTMPQARRRELLSWAGSMAAHVVEIDRIGDLRYDHEHLPALMSQDPTGRVCHVGDFGLVLGPWLSTAYLVVPPELAAPAEIARVSGHGDAGGIGLGILNEFIASDGYARHLVRIRKIYAARRERLVAALRAAFGGGQAVGAAAGLTLAWQPPAGWGTAERLAEIAQCCGVPARAVPHSRHANRIRATPGTLLIGFASLREDSVDDLAIAFARAARPHGRDDIDRAAAN